jgi:hypothetical protein
MGSSSEPASLSSLHQPMSLNSHPPLRHIQVSAVECVRRFKAHRLASCCRHQLIRFLQRGYFNDFNVPSHCELGEIPLSFV